MKNANLKIEGMRCSGCAAIIQALLERNAGVKKATASFDKGEAKVLFDPQATNEEQLVGVIEKAGYRVTGRTAG